MCERRWPLRLNERWAKKKSVSAKVPPIETVAPLTVNVDPHPGIGQTNAAPTFRLLSLARAVFFVVTFRFEMDPTELATLVELCIPASESSESVYCSIETSGRPLLPGPSSSSSSSSPDHRPLLLPPAEEPREWAGEAAAGGKRPGEAPGEPAGEPAAEDDGEPLLRLEEGEEAPTSSTEAGMGTPSVPSERVMERRKSDEEADKSADLNWKKERYQSRHTRRRRTSTRVPCGHGLPCPSFSPNH